MAEKKFEKGKEKKGLMMPGKKIEHPGKLFVRLMKYVLKNYTFSSVVVVVCIIVSVLANVQGTMFIRSLIDDFIEPMLKTSKTEDRKSTRLNSSHRLESRMPSSA